MPSRSRSYSATPVGVTPVDVEPAGVGRCSANHCTQIAAAKPPSNSTTPTLATNRRFLMAQFYLPAHIPFSAPATTVGPATLTCLRAMFTYSTGRGVHECVFACWPWRASRWTRACEDERTSRHAGKQEARCFTGAAGLLRCYRTVFQTVPASGPDGLKNRPPGSRYSTERLARKAS